MWHYYIMTFLTALIISLVMGPVIIRFAKKIGAIDKPNDRKVHSREVTRIGGLGIYIAFIAAFVYIYSVSQISLYILVGATIIVITGLLDDLFDLAPWQKLIGQFAATSVVMMSGLVIDYLTIPFIGESVDGDHHG
jgi:UDP-GlcNAc:undecaprenyl-phosphate GlcNAc-1-phosphate transferase